MKKLLLFACAVMDVLLIAGVQSPLGEPKQTVADVQYPERVFTNRAGRLCVDFGKDAFGWLEIDAPSSGLDYFLAMGEHLQEDGTLNRLPPPCVRCAGVKWHTERRGFQRVPVPPDLRNLFAAKEGKPIAIPEKFGVILPFRAVEIYDAAFPVTATTIRRQVVTYPADRNESAFACSDGRLTAVWDFCKYSMFATSFAGQFVDGDRERIPYEADTYVSQLNWYAISSDYAYPRRSAEYLYAHPTWPTEFKIISVLSAWSDWMWTGDSRSAKRHYDLLKGRLLLPYRRADGLLVSGGERMPHPSTTNRLGLADIVDWPKSERDGFDFRDVNAVVNAFHYRGLVAMAELAAAIGKGDDAAAFGEMARTTYDSFQKVFFDGGTGLYRDGEGSSHSSLHANVVALAFGLVPEDRAGRIADWLESRGMACSVYFSQYLLEALYRTGRSAAALRLLTAENDRSWIGMMRKGATITMEAWNRGVKPNLDWNHAWGATAINIISRFLLGVRPLEPGFRKILISPQVGSLEKVSAVVPTMKGPVRISVEEGALTVTTPAPAVIDWGGQRREVDAGCHTLHAAVPPAGSAFGAGGKVKAQGRPHSDRARAVWVAGAEKEMNAFYGFSAAFDVKRGENPLLRLSAGAIARVWVNGKFVGYGPARAPEGYMRVDGWPLGGCVTEGRNVIAIEVSNPAINTFYLPEQTGFLFAEVTAGGRTLAATGRDFTAVKLPRVAQTSRFSYQREFAEFYSVTPASDAWRTNGTPHELSVALVDRPLKPLGRGAPYPTFAFDGTFRPTFKTALRRDPGRKGKPLPYIDQTGKGALKGFAKERLAVNFSDAIQQLVAVRIDPARKDEGAVMRKNCEGVVFEGAKNTAGFPKIEVLCLSPATVWLVMDELASPDGLPDPVRFFSCVNACGWRLEQPGRYSLECFQPYGLKCAHVIVEGGEAVILGFDVRTYLNPDVARATFASSDPALSKLFAAAAQSLACNAVDVFTDCPGRERGAYFGDTVFTGRGADVLLGDTLMERTQFENYARAPRFADVPEGLIPMLYPGDTLLGAAHWIPNFCMWSVIQLADYVRRSGDAATAAAFRAKAEGILAWFRRSRSAEGLLEDLPGWVFIEWSDAAKFTKGINYPTNMLYLRFLEAFAELYGRTDCRDEAERMRETIRRLSWNGEWFRDHSVRGESGVLTTPEDCTEVCQYLAFFSDVATAQSHPDLWRRLVEEMGPMRAATAYPAVHRSNLLFGYSLRFVLLSKAGLSARVLREMKHSYLPMAEKTGTLWEAVSSDGYSCCHGFPSMVAWLLVREALGVKEIDRVAKTVKVAPAADLPLDWCAGTVPVSRTEKVSVKWTKEGGKPLWKVELPSGWKAK